MSIFTRLASRYIVPPTCARNDDGLRAVFDIEANGLLNAAAKVHCVGIADLDSDQVDAYGPEQIADTLAHLARASYLVGHNIVNYDLPLLRKLFNWAPAPGCAVMDTLVASRLILPHLDDLDDQAGSHGRSRRWVSCVGAITSNRGAPGSASRRSGSTSRTGPNGRSEMQERCVGDVAICKALWHFLQPDGYSRLAMELEHRVAPICERITADGVPFDLNAAAELSPAAGRHGAPNLQHGCRSNSPVRQPEFAASSSARCSKRAAGFRRSAPRRPSSRSSTMKCSKPYRRFIPSSPAWPSTPFSGAGLGNCPRASRPGPNTSVLTAAFTAASSTSARRTAAPSTLTPNLAQVPNPKKGKPFADRMPRAISGTGGLGVRRRRSGDAAGPRLRPLPSPLRRRRLCQGISQRQPTSTGRTRPRWASLPTAPSATRRARYTALSAREQDFPLRVSFRLPAPAAPGRSSATPLAPSSNIDGSSDLLQQFFAGAAHPSEAALKRVGRRAQATSSRQPRRVCASCEEPQAYARLSMAGCRGSMAAAYRCGRSTRR